MIRIIMLVGKGDSSKIIYNELKNYFNIIAVIEENKPSLLKLIKKRIKRFGLWTVIGQLIFIMYLKILKKISISRINQIKDLNKLNTNAYDSDKFFKVNSINDSCVADKLIALKPDIVVVNGTRIIEQTILSTIGTPFINTHAGITPRYRGVHGGYWALVENNFQLCGVTVHLVDEGIDTGGALYQTLINPTVRDNFLTYPYLQIAAALPILRKAIEDIYRGSYQIINNSLSSRLYSHPTIFNYFKNYLLKKIK